ncbi:MAG: T9SS type B sorting domain-containing protein [Bacteroidetes bacterium]|nr:T9SS type B sorting domain-containing protein [Bacteroidota bacterium]
MPTSLTLTFLLVLFSLSPGESLFNSATILDSPISIINIENACDDANHLYTVSFEITGGIPPYTVSGTPGTLTGNYFIIDPLVEGIPYNITITDSGGNEPFSVINYFFCECDTYAGSMDQTPIHVCEGETAVAIHNGDQSLISGDLFGFVIHPGDPDDFFAFNLNAPSFNFSSFINLNTTYYITAAAGDVVQYISGGDLTDNCISIAFGTPVTWHPFPTAYATTISACETSNGQAEFHLSSYDNVIGPGTDIGVNWFLDASLQNAVPNPSSFLSSSTTVYAVANNGYCESEAVPVHLIVELRPQASSSQLTRCDDGIGNAVFDLSTIENTINSGSGDAVNWYSDNNGQNPINNPSNYSSLGGTIFATVFDGICESLPVPVVLFVTSAPSADNSYIELSSSSFCDEGTVFVNFTLPGQGDYTITLEYGNSSSGYQTLELLESNGGSISFFITESTDFILTEVSAGNDCVLNINNPDIFSTSVYNTPDLELNDFLFLCEGESLDLNTVDIQDNNNSGASITFHSSLPPDASNELSSSIVAPAFTTTYFAFAESELDCSDVLDLEVQVDPLPEANPTLIMECTIGEGLAIFDLSEVENTVNPFPGNTVLWYEDDLLNSPINSLTSFLSESNTIYAVTTDGVCSSNPVPVELIVQTGPEIGEAFISLDEYDLCAPQTVILTLTLLSNESFDIEILYGNDASGYDIYSGSNQSDGDMIPFFVDETTHFALTTISDNDCTYALSHIEETVSVFSLPEIYADISDVNCFGTNTGSIDVAVIGDSPPFEYDWNGTELDGLSNPIGLAPGSYSLTVTDNNGCSSSEDFQITEPESISINCTEFNPVSSVGGADGEAEINISGGIAPYSLSLEGPVPGSFIVNGPGAFHVFDLTTGIYQISLSDANGCNITCSLEITQPSCDFTLELEPIHVLCFGESSGSLTANVIGGQGTLSFSWNNGADGYTISNLSVGTYCVSITDIFGCTLTACETIQEPDSLYLQITSSDVICAGEGTGSITGTALGGTTPYQLSINGQDFQNDQIFSQLNGGLYTVFVLDANDCIDSVSVEIAEPDPLFLSCEQISQASSPITGDGQATVFFSGGIPPYSLEWQGSVNGTFTTSSGSTQINDLLPGSYSLVVTDNSGCTENCDLVISSVNCDVLATINIQNITCEDLADGAMDLVVSGGTPPYSYDWNDDGLDGVEDPQNIIEGNYKVTVTDANSCFSTAEADLTFTFEKPKLNIEGIDDYCADDCFSVSISFTGTSPYSLNFLLKTPIADIPREVEVSESLYVLDVCPSDYGITSGTIEIIFNELEDENCSNVLSQTEYIEIIPTTYGNFESTLCSGESIEYNGTVYDAGNDSGTEMFTNSNGCDSLVAVQLNFLPEASSFLSQTLCESESIIVNTTEYNINNSSGTEILENASSTGCDSIIYVNLQFEYNSNTTINNTFCPDESISVNGVIYDINNPVGQEILTSQIACDSIVDVALNFLSEAVNNYDAQLCSGETLIVNGTIYGENHSAGTEILLNESANGCDSIVYVNLSFLNSVVENIDQTLCQGDNIVVNNIVYDINNPSGAELISGGSVGGCDSLINVNLSFNQLVSDNLELWLCNGKSIEINNTIYDQNNPSGVETFVAGASNGCDSLLTIQLEFGDLSIHEIQDTLCYYGSLTVNGKLYDRDTPSGIEVIDNGSYQGCDSVINVELAFLPPFTASLSGDTSICLGEEATLILELNGANEYDLILTDDSNNQEHLFVPDGHAIALSPAITTTYSIIDGEGFFLDGTHCTIAEFGSITVHVSDLQATMQVISDFNGYEVSCSDSNDGVAEIMPQQGVPPYSFSWSNTSQGIQATNLTAGTHLVTLTDAFGCEYIDSVSLNAPPQLKAEMEEISPACANGNDGSISLTHISGGIGPYEYSENGEFYQLIDALPYSINQLSSNQYSIYIQDMNDCSIVQTVTVENPISNRTVDLGEDLSISLGDSVQLTPSANFEIQNFAWSPPNFLSCPECLMPFATPDRTRTYSFTAYDDAGCPYDDDIRIAVVKSSRGIFVPNVFSPDGDGKNDEFLIFAGNEVVNINSFQVFNRWGVLLYEVNNIPPNNRMNAWDGTYKGQKLQPAVFIYIAEIEYIDGSTEILSGDVTLVR